MWCAKLGAAAALSKVYGRHRLVAGLAAAASKRRRRLLRVVGSPSAVPACELATSLAARAARARNAD